MSFESFFAAIDLQCRSKTFFDRERMLSEVVLHTPECVKLITVDGTLLDMNPAGLDLIEADDFQSVKGANVYSLVAPEHLDNFRQFNERVCAGNKESLEFELVALKGTKRWMHSTAVPFKLPNGATVHLAITREVTNEKLREIEFKLEKERAEAASVAKSEFVANMSHEIRTPMTAILGFTETLFDHIQSEEGRENCEIVRRNGEHLLEIINDILDLSKIESGKLEVEMIQFNLRDLLHELQRLMQVRADAKGLNWRVSIDTNVPQTIVSDVTRIRQIILNLVGNALKFTEVGGVELCCTVFNQSDDQLGLKFRIRDTGIGMTPRQLEQAFLPFMQADSSVTRRFGGSGLGLAISRRLAEMLGGGLTCSSEIGCGSEFVCHIYVHRAENEDTNVPTSDLRAHHGTTSEPENEAAASTALPLRGFNCLLVEDGPDNQRLISFMLRKAGATVALEENGQLGVSRALHAMQIGQHFEAILMDMQMPVMDGYTATRELRANGYTGTIIALTAHAMSSDRSKCIEAGCDAYLTKPIEQKTLIETVRSSKPRKLSYVPAKKLGNALAAPRSEQIL